MESGNRMWANALRWRSKGRQSAIQFDTIADLDLIVKVLWNSIAILVKGLENRALNSKPFELWIAVRLQFFI